DALAAPRWTLFLGRKAFVPSVPVLVPEPLGDAPPEARLRAEPWRPPADPRAERPKRLRLTLETTEELGTPRLDVPVTFEKGKRAFLPRFVRTDWVETASLPSPDNLEKENAL